MAMKDTYKIGSVINMQWYYNKYGNIELTSDDGYDTLLLQTQDDVEIFCDMYGLEYEELAIGDCDIVEDMGYFYND